MFYYLSKHETDLICLIKLYKDKFKLKNKVLSNKQIIKRGSHRKKLLETYNKIDVALDPFPYSGGTTSFESAWMGVPLYVLKGKTFLSKCGESINNNLGMCE